MINFLAAIENYGKSIEIKKQQLESLEKSVDVATKLFRTRAPIHGSPVAQRDLMEVRLVVDRNQSSSNSTPSLMRTVLWAEGLTSKLELSTGLIDSSCGPSNYSNLQLG